MNKSELKITKYEFTNDDNEYALYLIPEGEFLSFYIQRKGYGDIYHTVGIRLNDIPEDIEELINNNLSDWISIADMNTIE